MPSACFTQIFSSYSKYTSQRILLIVQRYYGPANSFIVYNIIIVVSYYKYARSKLRNALLIAVFGLILLSVIPTLLDCATTNIRLAIAQPEDPFPMPPARNLAELSY